MQDTGKAVVSPTQGDAPAKKVAGAAKEIGGDAAQKGEGAPEKMKKLNADYHDKNKMEMEHPKKKKNGNGATMEGYTDEEVRQLCHSKDHDCATMIEHPVWGLGNQSLVHTQYQMITDLLSGMMCSSNMVLKEKSVQIMLLKDMVAHMKLVTIWSQKK